MNAFQREVTILRQARKDSQAGDRFWTDTHARDRIKSLRQHELVVSDPRREVWFLSEQAEEAEKVTANIEDRLKTVFSRCTSLGQVVRVGSAALSNFLEGSIQDFLHNLSKRVTGH